ncbi:MAG: hypothetical protein ACR2ID_11255 [Chthoniobacterales bacterium]
MKLIVWQKAAMQLFQLNWKLAYEEAAIDFKLRSQVADSAPEVSANLSEGIAETMTRTIGLTSVGRIGEERFHEFYLLHDEAENRPLRLIENQHSSSLRCVSS